MDDAALDALSARIGTMAIALYSTIDATVKGHLAEIDRSTDQFKFGPAFFGK
jgi:hypothetical protein